MAVIDADWVRAGGGPIGPVWLTTGWHHDGSESSSGAWYYYAPSDDYGLDHYREADCPEDLARLLTETLLPHAAEMAADLRVAADEIEAWAAEASGVEWDGVDARMGDLHLYAGRGNTGFRWEVFTAQRSLAEGIGETLQEVRTTAIATAMRLLSAADSASSDPPNSALSDAGGG